MSAVRLGKTGIWMMIWGALISGSCFLCAFIFDHYFSMTAQVASHIGFFISPLAIKLGYVFKLASDNQLRKELSNA